MAATFVKCNSRTCFLPLGTSAFSAKPMQPQSSCSFLENAIRSQPNWWRWWMLHMINPSKWNMQQIKSRILEFSSPPKMARDGKCFVACCNGQNHLGSRLGCGLCQAPKWPASLESSGLTARKISSIRRLVYCKRGFFWCSHWVFMAEKLDAWYFPRQTSLQLSHQWPRKPPGTENVYHSEVGKPISLSVRKGCSRTSKGPVSLLLGTLKVAPLPRTTHWNLVLKFMFCHLANNSWQILSVNFKSKFLICLFTSWQQKAVDK